MRHAGLHPGFMRVGAALVVDAPANAGSKPGQGKFRGMIMERLNGPPVADALHKADGLRDVHYIRSMLFQAWQQTLFCMPIIAYELASA